MGKPATPNLDRLNEVKHKSQAIGEFIERLNTGGLDIGPVDLCYWETEGGRLTEGRLTPVPLQRDEIIARFFQIDRQELDRERQAVIDNTLGTGW